MSDSLLNLVLISLLLAFAGRPSARSESLRVIPTPSGL
jgi:hypothetical protein